MHCFNEIKKVSRKTETAKSCIFRTMYGDQMTEHPQDAEERRRHFLFELNTSGKYFAFKEQLKYYIVKLVREKFLYKKVSLIKSVISIGNNN